MPSRREFLVKASIAGAGALLAGDAPLRAAPRDALLSPALPVAIASGNGKRAVDRAMEVIRTGADALDAVIAGVNIIESDPDDMSVGYGGLPKGAHGHRFDLHYLVVHLGFSFIARQNISDSFLSILGQEQTKL